MNQDQQPSTNQPFTPPDTSLNQPTPPPSPETKKKGLLIGVLIAVGVMVAGIVAFAVMNSGQKDDKITNNSTSSDSSANTGSSKYQTYDVTDKTTGITFSVSFYKGASVIEKSGRTFLSVGEEGSQYSVYLGAGKEGKINCGNAPSTTMRLNGESTTICYTEDGTQYGGYVTTKGMTVQLNLAGQKSISLDEAKTIMESATFK